MKENDFITLMVQETLNLQTDADIVPTISAYEDRDKACIVISNDEGEVLEIPKIWGPFKSMMGNHVYISQDNDSYEFLSILNSFLGHENLAVRIILGENYQTQDQRRAA